MRVIIPAAGRGTRLIPLSHFSPKCLVEVDDHPILYYLLTSLRSLSVEEVIIVTGYKGEMIASYVSGRDDFPPVTCIHNKDFETTNSIVSVALTRKYWDKDFCIIDSDLLLRKELIAKLLAAKETCLIVDNSKPVSKVDMKVKVENGFLRYMDKFLPRNETFGEFFGLSKWTAPHISIFDKKIQEFLDQNETGVWYEFVIREMAKQVNIPVETCSSDLWFEVDNMQDYEIALDFFK